MMLKNISNFKNLEKLELNSKGCHLSKIQNFPNLKNMKIKNTTYTYKFIISDTGIIIPP